MQAVHSAIKGSGEKYLISWNETTVLLIHGRIAFVITVADSIMISLSIVLQMSNMKHCVCNKLIVSVR